MLKVFFLSSLGLAAFLSPLTGPHVARAQDRCPAVLDELGKRSAELTKLEQELTGAKPSAKSCALIKRSLDVLAAHEKYLDDNQSACAGLKAGSMDEAILKLHATAIRVQSTFWKPDVAKLCK